MRAAGQEQGCSSSEEWVLNEEHRKLTTIQSANLFRMFLSMIPMSALLGLEAFYQELQVIF